MKTKIDFALLHQVFESLIYIVLAVLVALGVGHLLGESDADDKDEK